MDLFNEGYGAGMMNLSWVRTVAGRFLRDYERAVLASGWYAGKRDRETWLEDMKFQRDVAFAELPY